MEANGDDKTIFTLSELTGAVRDTLEATFPETYWVRAETSDVRVNAASGHCYLEFIEKNPKTNQLVAKARGSIWAKVFRMLKPYFEMETGQTFTSGLKVLVKVTIEFHELYGFSLNVVDIDPTYTIGDMARKRQEIIRQLQADGVFTLNKELTFPDFPTRIAVITSPTAAGYEDFLNQLLHNQAGYPFYPKLFPALMQGEKTEESVIAALERIDACREYFDVVVIIRGGGATSDLSGFDTLALAENVANFPLPIITGIGHERDESVLDMISFQKVKTPTAAAAFLVQHLTDVYVRVMEAQETIVQNVKHRLQVEKMRLDRLNKSIPVQFSLVKTRQGAYIDRLMNRLSQQVLSKVADAQRKLEIISQNVQPVLERKMMSESHRLQMLEQRIRSQDPELLLKRGYSITLKNGKSIRSASLLTSGDVIVTRFAEGTVKSKVE